MRLAIWMGLLALLLSGLSVADEHVTVVHAQTLIDGSSARPRQNQDIVIRGNRIVEVNSAGARPIPSGAKVIDLTGATVLPGLIDTHTHIFLQGEVPAAGGYDIQLLKYPASFRAARAAVAARRALEQGFTTIRDVETEGAGYGDVGIKKAIKWSERPAVVELSAGLSSPNRTCTLQRIRLSI